MQIKHMQVSCVCSWPGLAMTVRQTTVVCKQLRQEAAGKVACADHTKHADQQSGTAASRRAAFGLPTHQWHSRSHLVISHSENGMVFQHQLCNVCIVLTHNRLDEAVQRRLALCSHHASSGALLLLVCEQSRGQGQGQTGVNRGSGHDPAGVRANLDEGQVGGGEGGCSEHRGPDCLWHL